MVKYLFETLKFVLQILNFQLFYRTLKIIFYVLNNNYSYIQLSFSERFCYLPCASFRSFSLFFFIIFINDFNIYIKNYNFFLNSYLPFTYIQKKYKKMFFISFKNKLILKCEL